MGDSTLVRSEPLLQALRPAPSRPALRRALRHRRWRRGLQQIPLSKFQPVAQGQPLPAQHQDRSL